jgi:hypothetical protein
MRQCEIQRVVESDFKNIYNRTGKKVITFIDNVNKDMVGNIINLKNLNGLWVINAVYDPEIEKQEIRRSWHVGGL